MLVKGRSYIMALALGLALACANQGKRGSGAGGSAAPTDAGAAGESGVSEAPVDGGAGGERFTAAEAGVAGLDGGGGAGGNLDAGEGGQGGDGAFALPNLCPGVLDDYTSIAIGTDEDDAFMGDVLDGQCLILGGSGADVFGPSPPGAGDCLLGGDGDDWFETAFLSAPATFVGGEGADTFVLRGSLDTDVAHISDFSSSEHDRVLLDAMVYGLSDPLAAIGDAQPQLAVVPGFVGGNSTGPSGARILYNPEDGGVWFDSDGEGEVAESVCIAVIENFLNYEFSIDDWGLD